MIKIPQLVTPERQQRLDPTGRWLGIAGGVVLAASASCRGLTRSRRSMA